MHLRVFFSHLRHARCTPNHLKEETTLVKRHNDEILNLTYFEEQYDHIVPLYVYFYSSYNDIVCMQLKSMSCLISFPS